MAYFSKIFAKTERVKVTTLAGKKLSSGAHFVTWRGLDALGRPVASGIYIYRLQTDSFVESKKMLLLR